MLRRHAKEMLILTGRNPVNMIRQTFRAVDARPNVRTFEPTSLEEWWSPRAPLAGWIDANQCLVIDSTPSTLLAPAVNCACTVGLSFAQDCPELRRVLGRFMPIDEQANFAFCDQGILGRRDRVGT